MEASIVNCPAASNTWIAPKCLAVAAWSNRIRCRIGLLTSLISGITMLLATARSDRS